MNTAKLEHCKELYELSGWEDTSYWHAEVYAVTEPTIAMWDVIDHRGGHGTYPAYDCGYLLRKLPREIDVDGDQVALDLCPMGDSDNWLAMYYSSNTLGETVEAETPEDALCLLAIKLLKEGTITREII